MQLLIQEPFDVPSTTATDLCLLLQDGKITSVKIVDTFQQHIEKFNSKLRAIICMPRDVREVAQALDDERREGRVRGLLHGIPIIVKVRRGVVVGCMICIS
jgi:amidase